MAFARIVAALAADEPFELYGDGSQSRSFTYVADVVAATDARAGGVARASTTSAAARRRRCGRRCALLESVAGRAAAA